MRLSSSPLQPVVQRGVCAQRARPLRRRQQLSNSQFAYLAVGSWNLSHCFLDLPFL